MCIVIIISVPVIISEKYLFANERHSILEYYLFWRLFRYLRKQLSHLLYRIAALCWQLDIWHIIPGQLWSSVRPGTKHTYTFNILRLFGTIIVAVATHKKVLNRKKWYFIFGFYIGTEFYILYYTRMKYVASLLTHLTLIILYIRRAWIFLYHRGGPRKPIYSSRRIAGSSIVSSPSLL